MRAKEFISQQEINEVAPLVAALGGMLARGAAAAGTAIARGAVSGLGNLAKQGVTQIGKQLATQTANNVMNKIVQPTGSLTTQTQQSNTLQLPTPADLIKLKGQSIPTDTGKFKIGNTTQNGLEIELGPDNKLSQFLGNKITIPIK